MNKLKISILLVFCGIQISINTFAADNKKDNSIVKLVVSAEAPTREDAINFALRSAVEQAYGVFVSSSTVLENDELVKDKIATVSSGTVASYEEIDAMKNLAGNWFVTIEAKVSIGKMLSYSHQSGMNSNVDGSAIIARQKLIKLNRENTKIALNNLFDQLEALAPDLFDFQVVSNYLGITDNETKTRFLLAVKVLETPNTKNFIKVFTSTLTALSIPEDEAKAMFAEGYKIYGCSIETLKQQEKKSSTWHPFIAELGSILFTGRNIDENNARREEKKSKEFQKADYYLYSMYTDEMCQKLNTSIKNAYNNFLIRDNLGKYYPFPLSYDNLMYFVPGKFVKYRYWDNKSFVEVTQDVPQKNGKTKQEKIRLYLMNYMSEEVVLNAEYAGEITQFLRIIPTNYELKEYYTQQIREQSLNNFCDSVAYKSLKKKIELGGEDFNIEKELLQELYNKQHGNK